MLLLDIEYVPTPPAVLDQMLEAADLDDGDLVYDLGCGDGRVVIEAARRYGARGVGIDLDPLRVAEARSNVARAGVGDLVAIEHADIFGVDLRPASVVTLYLLPDLNVRLLPQLRQLDDGARVISHDFPIAGVDYDEIWTIVTEHHRPRPKLREHYVLKWIAPLGPVSH